MRADGKEEKRNSLHTYLPHVSTVPRNSGIPCIGTDLMLKSS